MREGNNMFNAKLRKNAIDNYNAAVKRYEKVANDLGENTKFLYKEREKALMLSNQLRNESISKHSKEI